MDVTNAGSLFLKLETILELLDILRPAMSLSLKTSPQILTMKSGYEQLDSLTLKKMLFGSISLFSLQNEKPDFCMIIISAKFN